MRVVELEAVLLGEVLQFAAVLTAPVAHRILQAGRCEEVLLPQPKFATVVGIRVRIQNHRDVLGLILGGDRICITARVEFLEIERVGCRSRPEPERIADAVLVARHGDIVRDGQHVLRVAPFVSSSASRVRDRFRSPTELDDLSELEALDLPGETFTQPGIGLLYLITVFDELMEHAVVIADAVAHDRQRERRAAVEETRR